MRFIYSKTFFWLFIALLFLVVVMFIQVKGFGGPLQRVFLAIPRPIQKTAQIVTVPIRNFFSTSLSLKKIVNKNNELEQKVTAMQQELVLLQDVKKENEVLKKELEVVGREPWKTSRCTVLAKDPQGITDTVVIDCGNSSGIRVGQAVLGGGYLVGRVIFLTQNSATVQLLSNPDSSVDIEVSKSGARGLIKGSFGSGATIDLIAQNAELNKGDLIVTAGINADIPKGILVGTAGEIVSSASDLFKKATLYVPTDLRDLTYVLVVRYP